jgi:outer membrane protein OmpA-like peptidoglycan-associated protein
MIYKTLILLLAMLLGNISAAQSAETAGQSLPERLQLIESLQRRADRLAFGEPGPDNYHLAKARTWLDMALSKYYENDGADIIPVSIAQAEALLDALENDQSDIPMDTPVQVPGTEAVRPDLWEKIAGLKNLEKFSCGQRAIAEAEVHLVWAGREKFESSWSDAKSYARRAEELLDEAQISINGCLLPVRSIERIIIFSDMLFKFGDASLDPAGLWRLHRLVDRIKLADSLDEIVLVGHTDRLRSDGHPERNQLLSELRARSIKQYLIAKGISGEIIHARGVGSAQPLVQCPTNTSKARQIVCLEPNRRVEITLRGTK